MRIELHIKIIIGQFVWFSHGQHLFNPFIPPSPPLNPTYPYLQMLPQAYPVSTIVPQSYPVTPNVPLIYPMKPIVPNLPSPYNHILPLPPLSRFPLLYPLSPQRLGPDRNNEKCSCGLENKSPLDSLNRIMHATGWWKLWVLYIQCKTLSTSKSPNLQPVIVSTTVCRNSTQPISMVCAVFPLV